MKGHFFLNKQKGFTLVEVLASLSILGIITVAVLTFFTQSYDYTKRNQSKTVGINVARNVMNYFEQLNFEELYQEYEIESIDPTGTKITLADCDSQSSFYTSSCAEILQPTINNVEYKTFITLKKYDTNESDEDYLNENLIRIEVEVKWKDKETVVTGLLKK